MKKILIMFLLSIITLQAKINSVTAVSDESNNVQKYDIIFEQISKRRVGPDDKELNKIISPFVSSRVLKIIKDKNATKVKPIILKLYGIINNRANINKKWYKIRGKVYGYRLVRIKDTSVVLKRKRKKVELFLRKKNAKIKIIKNF